jgi:hypothetical protein
VKKLMSLWKIKMFTIFWNGNFYSDQTHHLTLK